jgi:hypothetical protein
MHGAVWTRCEIVKEVKDGIMAEMKDSPRLLAEMEVGLAQASPELRDSAEKAVSAILRLANDSARYGFQIDQARECHRLSA